MNLPARIHLSIAIVVGVFWSLSFSAAAKTLAECQQIKQDLGMTEFMKCVKGATTGASKMSKVECFDLIRTDVDWVFTDNGALDTYIKSRSSGKGVFGALMAAQGHNSDARKRLTNCKAWVADYVFERSECGKIQEGIAWIFRDQGAQKSYLSARSSGKSKFQSALFAQRHNQPFQRLMKHCEGQVLYELGPKD